MMVVPGYTTVNSNSKLIIKMNYNEFKNFFYFLYFFTFIILYMSKYHYFFVLFVFLLTIKAVFNIPVCLEYFTTSFT